MRLTIGARSRDKGSGSVNPFELRLREGRMITRIGVEVAEESDDWVTIEFGPPNPAISPFVVKPKSGSLKD
jgi:hypothetical protein